MYAMPEDTERLTWRRLATHDLDFVAEMLADPEVMRYYPRTYTRQEAMGWIERQLARYERDGHGLWLISERNSGAPAGQVGLIIQEVDGKEEPEIGYLVHRPFWRRGYATEAARAVRALAFDTLGLPYVISLIRPENIPSQGVARKLGMQPVRETMFHDLKHLVFLVRTPTSVSRPSFVRPVEL